MSGHSKWATTHRQKAAADAKRGSVFTKLGNLITIAAREGGGDLGSNFKLRLAVDKARAANLPKDNIERAIKRGTGRGGDGAVIEEITYEIFGPAKSAFIVEAVTDNKNRAISEIKNILNKHGGQLAGPNSVLWLFERKGLIEINIDENVKNPDELELAIIDAGAQDIIKNDGIWEIYTAPDRLQETEKKLKTLNAIIKESSLAYIPKNEMIIKEKENQEKIENLFKALDECDDINNIYLNASW